MAPAVLLGMAMLKVLVGALVVACTPNHKAPLPTCKDIEKRTAELSTRKVPNRRGWREMWKIDLDVQTQAACKKGLSEEQLRCAAGAADLVDILSCNLPGVRVTERDMHANCIDAATGFAVYLFDPKDRSHRKTFEDTWATCDREKWGVELRDCWAGIVDTPSHDACLALRKKLQP